MSARTLPLAHFATDAGPSEVGLAGATEAALVNAVARKITNATAENLKVVFGIGTSSTVGLDRRSDSATGR
jgi:hypothetical protein